MELIEKNISLSTLSQMSKKMFGGLVKAVVDIEKRIIAVDAEMHVDLEFFLLEKGSLQEHLWGINFYPDKKGNDFIEFDSMINVRPSQGNVSRTVENSSIQKIIRSIVEELVKNENA